VSAPDAFEAWLIDEEGRLRHVEMGWWRKLDGLTGKRASELRTRIAEVHGRRLGLAAAEHKYRELRR